jgi:hypothetical protein
MGRPFCNNRIHTILFKERIHGPQHMEVMALRVYFGNTDRLVGLYEICKRATLYLNT